MNATMILAENNPNLWEFISSIGIWIWEHPVPMILFAVGLWVFLTILGFSKKIVLSTGPLLSWVILLSIALMTVIIIVVLGMSLGLIPKVGTMYWNNLVKSINNPVEIQLPGDSPANTTPSPTQPSGLPTAPKVCAVKNSMTATFRELPDAVSQILAEIPASTPLTLEEFKSSNCVDNVCWRGKTTWNNQVGWVHGAAMDCP